MTTKHTVATLTARVIELESQLENIGKEYEAKLAILEDYLPIVEEWNKTKNIQAIEIESIISSAVLSRRVEFTLWLINQPLVVLIVTLTIGIGIKYETSTVEDPFSFNSGTTWIIVLLISGISLFLSSLSKAYENSQKKGDSMILADIERSIKPWLKELKDEMVKERLESEARIEKQRKEDNERIEKQRKEDNESFYKLLVALEKRISEPKA
jgi:hypothetical protein